MEKTTVLFLALIIVGIILISGCSDSRKQPFRKGEFPGEAGRGFAGRANMTEAERQQLFQERQQEAKEACSRKDEGDSCMLETPRGKMESTCKKIESDLVCIADSPMRQGSD